MWIFIKDQEHITIVKTKNEIRLKTIAVDLYSKGYRKATEIRKSDFEKADDYYSLNLTNIVDIDIIWDV